MFVGTVYRKKVPWIGNHTATTCKDEGHGRMGDIEIEESR